MAQDMDMAWEEAGRHNFPLPAEIRLKIYKLTLANETSILIKRDQTKTFNDQRLMAPSPLIGINRTLNREYYAALFECAFTPNSLPIKAEIIDCDFSGVVTFLRDPMRVAMCLPAIMLSTGSCAPLQLVLNLPEPLPRTFREGPYKMHKALSDSVYQVEQLGVTVKYTLIAPTGKNLRVVLRPAVPWRRQPGPHMAILRLLGGRADEVEERRVMTWIREERRARMMKLGLTGIHLERGVFDIGFLIRLWD